MSGYNDFKTFYTGYSLSKVLTHNKQLENIRLEKNINSLKTIHLSLFLVLTCSKLDLDFLVDLFLVSSKLSVGKKVNNKYIVLSEGVLWIL